MHFAFVNRIYLDSNRIYLDSNRIYLHFFAFEVPVEFFRVRNRIFVAIAFRMLNAI